MVLTVSFVLSSVTMLFCHRRLANMVLSKPGWADLPPQTLTPALERQNHTTSPSASASVVGVPSTAHGPCPPALPSRHTLNAAASTASHPNVRDGRDTPLCGTGRGESV